jgi:hypothetical protein
MSVSTRLEPRRPSQRVCRGAVGYQALESISRGFYRPSSSEIRLMQLLDIKPSSRSAAVFTGPVRPRSA